MAVVAVQGLYVEQLDSEERNTTRFQTLESCSGDILVPRGCQDDALAALQEAAVRVHRHGRQAAATHERRVHVTHRCIRGTTFADPKILWALQRTGQRFCKPSWEGLVGLRVSHVALLFCF